MNTDTIKDEKLYRNLWILILISFVVRGTMAAVLDLGNDEVYYWTYALFPDWSHFDHPSMIGWSIQLFSFDLLFDHEFFIRLSSLVFGAINTYLIFSIGTKLKDQKTGWYAALLYTASLYGFVITGIFILPDTPQMLFWFLSINIIIVILPSKQPTSHEKKLFLLASLMMGLAMLSKYTSAFLCIGTGLYILFFNRNWLKTYAPYLGAILSALCIIPVFIWNYKNDFISFTFHGDRVGLTESGINWGTFFTELGGQIGYNNPVVYILIVIALIGLFKRNYFNTPNKYFLLFTALPMIGLFLGFALFKRTLPHWTAPAVTSLIFFPAAWLADKHSKTIPNAIKAALGLLALVLILGIGQIQFGFMDSLMRKGIDDQSLGKYDVTLDMYGWDQIQEPFAQLVKSDIEKGLMDSNSVIISNKWFPAAHLDYYVATPLNMNLLCIGSLIDIHKYDWINKDRGGFKKGMNAYFLTTSTQFYDPLIKSRYIKYFNSIELADTIKIVRSNRHVKNVFVFRMKDLDEIPLSK
ncbi:MAG: glycosyltransferase family 39 protein [Bacteroidales bacterium]|nr:glycosyltransferase family 39 protein [Bacteroidales bacterium]